MIEDKLDQDQRIRLEAIQQANMIEARKASSVEQILETAGRVEEFIKTGAK